MKTWVKILEVLADGKFCSGEKLAEQLGCSRSAVWKHLQQIRALPDVTVDSVKGRGYRLTRPLDLLKKDAVLQSLSQRNESRLLECHILPLATSTNDLASQSELLINGDCEAWFAESQTAGRGRRGRAWISGFGDSIYFSLARKFDMPMGQLAGLSVATGAVLVNLLSRYGLQGHGLKWPNDVLWQERKLAGILVEAKGETYGPSTAVIGIGVNLRLSSSMVSQIEQPCASMADAGLMVARNQFAGDLLQDIISMCDKYSDEGLAPFLDAWRAADLYKRQQVSLHGPTSTIEGLSEGLADDGGLRVRVEGQSKTFYSGELSMRPKEGG